MARYATLNGTLHSQTHRHLRRCVVNQNSVILRCVVHPKHKHGLPYILREELLWCLGSFSVFNCGSAAVDVFRSLVRVEAHVIYRNLRHSTLFFVLPLAIPCILIFLMHREWIEMICTLPQYGFPLMLVC